MRFKGEKFAKTIATAGVGLAALTACSTEVDGIATKDSSDVTVSTTHDKAPDVDDPNLTSPEPSTRVEVAGSYARAQWCVASAGRAAIENVIFKGRIVTEPDLYLTAQGSQGPYVKLTRMADGAGTSLMQFKYDITTGAYSARGSFLVEEEAGTPVSQTLHEASIGELEIDDTSSVWRLTDDVGGEVQSREVRLDENSKTTICSVAEEIEKQN